MTQTCSHRRQPVFSRIVATIACVAVTTIASAQDDDPHGLSKMVGLKAGQCSKCHPGEVAQWEKSTHAISADRLNSPNAKKYAAALGIADADIASNSSCATCHTTQQKVDGKVVSLGGVSCEKCHGGAKDWLEPHWTYFDGIKFSDLATLRTDRRKETADHRKARMESIEKSGMIRPANIHKLAKNCTECHLIGDDKLIAAGHKAASSFELVSWSNGEVRHNFFMDKDTNAAAPTSWADNNHSNAANRDRVKFVVGTMAQAEAALRRRATAKNPVVIPQFGGMVAAANGKLAQINGVAGSAQTGVAAGIIGAKFGTLFVPMPTDEKIYNDAADQIATQIQAYIKNNDGGAAIGLDALIKALPPHYSQQYQKKYGTK